MQSLRQQLIAEFVAEQEAMRDEARRVADERAKRLSALLPKALEPIIGSAEFTERRIMDCPALDDAIVITVDDVELLARLVDLSHGDELVTFELITGECPECRAPLTAYWHVTTRYELAALLAREQQCPSVFIRCPYCGYAAGE